VVVDHKWFQDVFVGLPRFLNNYKVFDSLAFT